MKQYTRANLSLTARRLPAILVSKRMRLGRISNLGASSYRLSQRLRFHAVLECRNRNNRCIYLRKVNAHVSFGSWLCENSDNDKSCRKAFSNSSIKPSIMLAISKEGGQWRIIFYRFLPLPRFYTAWVNYCRSCWTMKASAPEGIASERTLNGRSTPSSSCSWAGRRFAEMRH